MSTPVRSRSFLEKYGQVLLAVMVFFILDAAVLVLNMFMVQQLHSDSLNINLAGRQRMLSQRMTKVLYQIQDAQARSAPPEDLQRQINELKGSVDLFESTLTAFASGGYTKDANLNPVMLERISSLEGQRAISNAQEFWNPLRDLLLPIFPQSPTVDPTMLAAAIQKAADNNLAILKQMNELTVDLEHESAHRAEILQWIQTGSIVMLFTIFVFIVWNFYTQILRGDEEAAKVAQSLAQSNQEMEELSRDLAKSKLESDLLLSTVRQGLMLIGPDFKIGPQYSQELKEIFRLEDLAGVSFLNLMQRLLSEKLAYTTKDYLDLLFDGARKEKQVLKVNPLDVVEVNFSNPAGGFLTKFLGFNFRRIVEDDEVVRVFVGVADITQQVNLEKELRQAEAKKDKQLSILLGILHAEPLQVQEFIALAKNEIEKVSQALRAEDFAAASTGKAEELRARLDSVARSIHNIKGNAAFLQLGHFEKLSEDFESKVATLRGRSRLSGEDFLTVVIAQATMREDLQELEEIHSKLKNLRPLPMVTRAPAEKKVSAPTPEIAPVPEDELIAGIRGLTSTMAGKLGKIVKVEAHDFKCTDFSPDDRSLVRDVMIQLVRNSLAHSLEAPEEREHAGKSREGVIAIRKAHSQESGWSGFTFADDGRGLDLLKIRDRAVAKGLISPDEAHDREESSFVPLIFEPGFSTTELANGDSGRGMGLDLIKEKVVDERGGEITVDLDPGRMCSFGIFLPN